MKIAGTVDLREAAAGSWDAVVIGAGPAGAVAARQLSRTGARTLLVDRSAFPRNKVCGACVGRGAVAILSRLGLNAMFDRLRAVPVDRFRLQSQGRGATLRLPEGFAVTRAAFDAELTRAAIEAGADFLPQTTASLGELTPDGRYRTVRLAGQRANVGAGGHRSKSGPESGSMARVVLAADGLGHSSWQRTPTEEFGTHVSANARIGLGAVTGEFPADYEPGTIYMALDECGYVGLVRVEAHGSRPVGLNVAAALDPQAVKRSRRPAELVASVIEGAGFPAVPSLQPADWHGTLPLTRSTLRPAARRVLVVGDAAGYVEPFTGEGIACALLGGAAAAGVAVRHLREWGEQAESEWLRIHRRYVSGRLHWCRWLGALLRRPRATRVAISLVSRAPWLARPIVSSLDRLPRGIGSLIEVPRRRIQESEFRNRNSETRSQEPEIALLHSRS